MWTVQETAYMSARRQQTANSEYDTARDFEDSTRKAYDEIIKSWEEQYAPYYDENVSIEIDDDTYRLDKDEIESRFTGLKTALSQKNSDFADKQALMNHLSASMNKCRDAIEYRGYTFDDIKAKYEAGGIMAAGSQQLRNAKDALNNLVKSSDSVREELESQEALLNRLEEVSHMVLTRLRIIMEALMNSHAMTRMNSLHSTRYLLRS